MSEEIKIDKGEEYTKFTITTPLITKDEEIILDSYLHDIVKDMNNCYVHDKELALMQEVTRRLEQENQQLKEQLGKATRVALSEQRWASKCEDRCINYQTLLDEIREYINNNTKEEYENIELDEHFGMILQILDKVKE